MDRNIDHFVDAWEDSHNGEFPEPDWEKMEETHQKVKEGTDEPVYPVYSSIFNGFQISAIEIFLEDTTPPPNVTNRSLLD